MKCSRDTRPQERAPPTTTTPLGGSRGERQEVRGCRRRSWRSGRSPSVEIQPPVLHRLRDVGGVRRRAPVAAVQSGHVSGYYCPSCCSSATGTVADAAGSGEVDWRAASAAVTASALWWWSTRASACPCSGRVPPARFLQRVLTSKPSLRQPEAVVPPNNPTSSSPPFPLRCYIPVHLRSML